MRSTFALSCLLAGGLTACSGNEGSSALNVAISGDVFQFQSDPDAPDEPLEDVEVCYQSTCDTTDADGRYSVLVPAESEVRVTYERSDFGPVVIPVTTESQSETVNADMLDVVTLTAFAALIDTPYPPEGTGYISLTVYSGPPEEGDTIAGVSFTLSSEGKAYYLDDSGVPSTSLTETAEPGAGGFVEVNPGLVTVELSGAVGCEGLTGWPVPGANTFGLPVEDGFLTQLTIVCE